MRIVSGSTTGGSVRTSRCTSSFVCRVCPLSTVGRAKGTAEERSRSALDFSFQTLCRQAWTAGASHHSRLDSLPRAECWRQSMAPSGTLLRREERHRSGPWANTNAKGLTSKPGAHLLIRAHVFIDRSYKLTRVVQGTILIQGKSIQLIKPP